MRIFFIFLIQFFFISGFLNADITLENLINATGTQLYWDSTLRRGYLVDDEKKVIFWVQNQKIIYGKNGKEIFDAVIFEKNGEIFFDDTTSQKIIEYFLISEKDFIEKNSIKSNTNDKTSVKAQKKPSTKAQKNQNESGIRRAHEVAVILIDPGHGGRDNGTIGRHSRFEIKEKDVALTVSFALESLLKKKYPNKTILMTRREDVYKSLKERVDMPRKEVKVGQAEIYLSIHANSVITNSETAYGFEVWCLPESFEREIEDHKEIPDSNLRMVLDKVVQEEYLVESERLASYLLTDLEKGIGNVSKNRGMRRKEWYVVRHAQMAAVLVELGFLSHPEEAKRLANFLYLKKLAKLLYNGTVKFIEYFEQQ